MVSPLLPSGVISYLGESRYSMVRVLPKDRTKRAFTVISPIDINTQELRVRDQRDEKE